MLTMRDNADPYLAGLAINVNPLRLQDHWKKMKQTGKGRKVMIGDNVHMLGSIHYAPSKNNENLEVVVRLQIPNADSVMKGQSNLSAFWNEENAKVWGVNEKKALYDSWTRMLLRQPPPPKLFG